MNDAAAGPATTFDLAAEAQALRDSALWRERGQSSRTLLKLPDFRLVMIALKSGHQIQRHQTDLRLNLNTVAGHVQLTVGDETIDLPAGRVLVVDPAIPHDVTALEDSVILLSLSSAAP
jgi:quercetin dioxygenase-like cupin family protein